MIRKNIFVALTLVLGAVPAIAQQSVNVTVSAANRYLGGDGGVFHEGNIASVGVDFPLTLGFRGVVWAQAPQSCDTIWPCFGEEVDAKIYRTVPTVRNLVLNTTNAGLGKPQEGS